MRPGKSWAICFLIRYWIWLMFNTSLVCVSESLSCGNRSCPIIVLWPSSTNLTLTFLAAQSLLFSEVLITPIVLINSFENVLRSWHSGDCTHYFSLVFNTTAFARLWFMTVQTLPESTNFSETNMHAYRLHFFDVVTIRSYSYTAVVEVVIVRVIVSIIHTMFLHHSFNMVYLFSYRCSCINISSFRRSDIDIFDKWFWFYLIFDFRQTFAKWFAIPNFFQFVPRAGQFSLWPADQAQPQLGPIADFMNLIGVEIGLLQEFWILLM